jgi:two-component system chemotaxis sensor kinase CheA
MSDDAEIVKEFLVESYENLDRLDQDLIALEKEPGNRETLASIFRTIHTIKGTAGFLAFNKLEAVAHVGESLLARLRDGVLKLCPEITTALLAMVDAVRQMLGSIEAQGNEGERNDGELIATLNRLLSGSDTPSAQPPTRQEQVRIEFVSQPTAPMGKTLIAQEATKISEVSQAAEHRNAVDTPRIIEAVVEEATVKPHDVLEASNSQQQARGQNARSECICGEFSAAS